MSKNKFGLSALMESMKYSEDQDRQSEKILENVIGEEAIDDDVKIELLEDELSNADIDAEIERLSDDPEIEKFIDSIPDEIDDEDEQDPLEEGWVQALEGLNI